MITAVHNELSDDEAETGAPARKYMDGSSGSTLSRKHIR